uniref:Uncharacterized protein n=1 Tax=Ditylenchus dipsaci TaxID=166011 RepID=A0A915DD90_9BILA
MSGYQISGANVAMSASKLMDPRLHRDRSIARGVCSVSDPLKPSTQSTQTKPSQTSSGCLPMDISDGEEDADSKKSDQKLDCGQQEATHTFSPPLLECARNNGFNQAHNHQQHQPETKDQTIQRLYNQTLHLQEKLKHWERCRSEWEELKGSQEQVVRLEDQENSTQKLEQTICELKSELESLRCGQSASEDIQSKLDSKEKAWRTAMDRIRQLDDQHRETSKKSAAKDRQLKLANEKCCQAEQEAAQWMAKYRRVKEKLATKKVQVSTIETGSNTDAFSLTPEHLQQCMEKSAQLQQELKEVCAEYKQNNALLLEDRQAMQLKQVRWTEEKELLNQLVRTANDQLNKYRADLKLAEAKIADQRQHRLNGNLVNKPRKRQRKASSDRASSEPITLADALQFVPRPSPASKVLGDMIVISSDDEEKEVSPVEVPLQLDATISPPKNVEASNLVVAKDNGTGTSPPACAIEQLETLTRSLESEMPVLMTPQKCCSNNPAEQTRQQNSGGRATAPQLTAQHFADYVAQSNQTSGRGAPNVRLEHGDPRVAANVSPAAQQSHHIQMLFVEFLKMYAKYIPAWTAIMPFCERHGVPAQARAQLILQLQPIANKFEEMKSTAGQYYLR